MRRAVTAALIGGLLSGCSAGSSGPSAPPPGPDVPAEVDPNAPLERHAEGAVLYASLCESCHGEVGDGGIGPAVANWTHGVDALRAVIAERMPTADPQRCTGDCADKIARFIADALTPEALACNRVGASPRRLRLLTRREYRNTVRDLFRSLGDTSGPCERATACAYRETCASGLCEATACNRQTFVFDPRGEDVRSVHVAGGFNGWPATRTEGGLPLGYDAGAGLWVGSFDLPEGRHQYKLVIDDGARWLADPRSPTSVPDGYGGSNSVLELSCAGEAAGGVDPAAALPVESRPAGFPFDNNADVAVVTPGHVDAYLAAAAAVARSVAARVDDVVACDHRGAPARCADQVVAQLGARAFRRPLSVDEEQRYRALFERAAAGDFAAGLSALVTGLLSSPHFLYRSELGEPVGGGLYQLSAYELATALSYTFWATGPDDALLAAAEAGELDDAAGVERHARRLLDDRRSRATVSAFAAMWLGADAIASMDKNDQLFPEFGELRDALERETEAFVAHVVFDGSGTLSELLTADYTMANDALAGLYGLVPPGGETLRPVPYEGQRAGIFGHGSVLGATAHSDQTSPVRRGLFVRERLLCQELPPPPPDAGAIPAVDPSATTRERFRQHSDDPFCAGCHQYIDDIGFGLEAFDPIGRFRSSEGGRPIDTSGNVPDLERIGSGTDARFSSLPELADLLAGSTTAQSCFVRQYYRFARGFEETLFNRCARLWLEERFAASGGDIRELMIDAVLAPDFRYRR